MFVVSYYFCRAIRSGARTIRQSLDNYCTALGRLANYHKLRVQFSKGVLNVDKKEISQIIQIPPPTQLVPIWDAQILIRKTD